MKSRFILLRRKDIIYVIIITAASIASIIYIFGVISDIFGK